MSTSLLSFNDEPDADADAVSVRVTPVKATEEDMVAKVMAVTVTRFMLEMIWDDNNAVVELFLSPHY